MRFRVEDVERLRRGINVAHSVRIGTDGRGSAIIDGPLNRGTWSRDPVVVTTRSDGPVDARMSYKVVSEIGRGGFGIVERVRNGKGDWARKTLNVSAQPGIDPADLRSRFEREVRYQSVVSHPNVAGIVDFDLTVDPPWFVMELAECSLEDEMKVDRTLGGDPRQPLFDILAGLQAIHDLGYKHRDLKPANVLKFANPDGTYRYAISDFGLMAPEAGQTSTLTPSNMGGGTPLYRAPECALNFKRATTLSDIYSVGAIIFQIFAPNPNRIPHLELSIAGPLGPIIEKCTKSNARRRYASISKLREDLFDALSDENLVFSSSEEKEVVDILTNNATLSADQWDKVFAQIDINEEAGRGNHAIFRALDTDHIEQLAADAPDLLASLGDDYAEYASGRGFDFDYCDVIASRAQIFFDHGELDLKSKIAIAMLELGTSHNRWYVERKFVAMVGPDADDALIDRIRVELKVQKRDRKVLLRRLRDSITIAEDALHPALD